MRRGSAPVPEGGVELLAMTAIDIAALKARYATSEEILMREVRLMEQVSHENVLSLRGRKRDCNTFFLYLELLQGP